MHSQVRYTVQNIQSRLDDPPQRWLRVRAAAEHLGIGVGTLNKLRSYGGGPLYSKMMAGVVAYDTADLDAWAAERKICSTSEPVRAA